MASGQGAGRQKALAQAGRQSQQQQKQANQSNPLQDKTPNVSKAKRKEQEASSNRQQEEPPKKKNPRRQLSRVADKGADLHYGTNSQGFPSVAPRGAGGSQAQYALPGDDPRMDGVLDRDEVPDLEAELINGRRGVNLEVAHEPAGDGNTDDEGGDEVPDFNEDELIKMLAAKKLERSSGGSRVGSQSTNSIPGHRLPLRATPEDEHVSEVNNDMGGEEADHEGAIVVKGGRRNRGGAVVDEVGYLDVDARLIRGRRAETTSPERATAMAVLMSNATGAVMYPTADELLYYRGCFEGMDAFDDNNKKSNPRNYFTKAEYELLCSQHTKACSSKRGELSGKKGLRGLFDKITGWDMLNAKTPEEKETQMKKKEELKDDKWHHDESGVPFSSETIKKLVKTVWQEPNLTITSEQLVWTCVVIDKWLECQVLGQNDNTNNDLCEAKLVEVCDMYMKATRAKKAPAVKLKPTDEETQVWEYIRPYIDEGGIKALRAKEAKSAGRERGGGRKTRAKKGSAWTVMNKLAAGDLFEAEDAAPAEQAE